MKLSPAILEDLLPDLIDVEALLPQFKQFCDLLIRVNDRINLISRYGDALDEVELQLRLSLAPLRFIVEKNPSSWIDIGSGGGFPAIPIKIALPGIALTLVESNGKKAEFLRKVIRDLGLTQCQVESHRAEDLVQKNLSLQETFDGASAKAVGPPAKIIPLVDSLVRTGGFLLTYYSSQSDLGVIPHPYCLTYQPVHVSVDPQKFPDTSNRPLVFLKRNC